MSWTTGNAHSCSLISEARCPLKLRLQYGEQQRSVIFSWKFNTVLFRVLSSPHQHKPRHCTTLALTKKNNLSFLPFWSYLLLEFLRKSTWTSKAQVHTRGLQLTWSVRIDIWVQDVLVLESSESRLWQLTGWGILPSSWIWVFWEGKSDMFARCIKIYIMDIVY